MNNIVEFVKQQEQFFLPAVVDNAVVWEKEAQFAIQSFQRNDFLARTAMSNPVSAQNAIINVAAIGITLNPAAKLAYLVPRDGGVCLDISYMGLMHLGMQSGSIMWAECQVVYANDKFKRTGVGMPPVFETDEFGERGEPVGVFCTAKTRDGDYLTETMSKKQILEIRDRSAGWKAYKKKGTSCPWVTDELEMWRKTVVKRGTKYWPKVERLDRAIDYLNTSNDEGIEQEPVMPHYTEQQKAKDAAANAAELAARVQEFIDKMEISENENQLKLAFQEAFKMTKGHNEMNQEVQKIYAKNKNRLTGE